MRPPEEKGKAGGQAILAAKTVRRNLFLPLAGGGAQHRRVVIHAAGCLSLLESGKMNVAPLISHELGLEEVQDFLDGKIQGVSKAVVKVGE